VRFITQSRQSNRTQQIVGEKIHFVRFDTRIQPFTFGGPCFPFLSVILCFLLISSLNYCTPLFIDPVAIFGPFPRSIYLSFPFFPFLSLPWPYNDAQNPVRQNRISCQLVQVWAKLRRLADDLVCVKPPKSCFTDVRQNSDPQFSDALEKRIACRHAGNELEAWRLAHR